MNYPAPDGGGDEVDENDTNFMVAAYQIEDCYGDLLGVESICKAITASWGETELHGDDAHPQVGDSSSGVGFGVNYTVPMTRPYQVEFRIHAYDEDMSGHSKKVSGQLDEIFHEAKGLATGTADGMKAYMAGIYGTDPTWLGWNADQQLQAVTHLHGQLLDDFAHIGPLMDDHFKSTTAEHFRSWYNQLDDVVNELVDYAGMAQVAAAGTANVLSVAKQAMARTAQSAAKAFQDSVNAWHDDPISFPFPPGTAERAMAEFTGLIHKVEDYASLIPGPISKAVGAAQTTEKVIGAASDLFGIGEPKDVKSASRADDLYSNMFARLGTNWLDASNALDGLGSRATPKKDEVVSRPQLVLPTEKPSLHYT